MGDCISYICVWGRVNCIRLPGRRAYMSQLDSWPVAREIEIQKGIFTYYRILILQFCFCCMFQMFERADCMVPVMLENALIETLCNMIAAIHSSPLRMNKAGVDERYLLIEDIQHFLALIAERTFR